MIELIFPDGEYVQLSGTSNLYRVDDKVIVEGRSAIYEVAEVTHQISLSMYASEGTHHITRIRLDLLLGSKEPA